MRTIENTKVRYIRCIKPNKEMHPGRTDHKETLNQLTCAGLVEALTVSRHYFQHRLSVAFAIEQFRCLADSDLRDAILTDRQAYAERMFSALLADYVVRDTSTDARAYAVGLTKVYFREGSLEHLEARRQIVVTTAAVKIQRWIRTRLARWHFVALIRGAIRLQAKMRCRKERRKFLRQRQASIRLQTGFRAKRARSWLTEMKADEAATKIQRWYRCRGSQWQFIVELEAARKIQRFVRRRLAKDRFSSMLSVVVEDARKDSQMKEILGSLKECHKATPQDFVQLQGLLQESFAMLHYAREQMFKLRSDVSNLKLDNDVLSEDNEKLKERYAYTKETNSAMKISMTKLNTTNNVLLDSLSRQRIKINNKTKELRASSKEIQTLIDDFETTKAKMEEDHRAEMAHASKETARLVAQHHLAMVEKEKGQKLRENKLQKEMEMLRQELKEEEESYNISFTAMMSALDRKGRTSPSKSSAASSRHSLDSQMSAISGLSVEDFDEESTVEI
uniref:Myosin motor domain-containing protein n=1 Tax=Corethron hystrix TaxID=216773 RepID=A0A7S1BLU1_9STRA